MAAKCRCCLHPKLTALNAALDRGLSYRKCAALIPPLSRDSIRRHQSLCRRRVAEMERREQVAESVAALTPQEAMLGKVRKYRKVAEGLVSTLYKRNDVRGASSALGALQKWVEAEIALEREARGSAGFEMDEEEMDRIIAGYILRVYNIALPPLPLPAGEATPAATMAPEAPATAPLPRPAVEVAAVAAMPAAEPVLPAETPLAPRVVAESAAPPKIQTPTSLADAPVAQFQPSSPSQQSAHLTRLDSLRMQTSLLRQELSKAELALREAEARCSQCGTQSVWQRVGNQLRCAHCGYQKAVTR